MADALLEVRELFAGYGGARRPFGRRGPATPVVKGVSFSIARGELLGIVGESGSGKTTLGRALLGLVKPLSGSVVFDGTDITSLGEAAMQPLRRRMQMIFQDPMSSLNPRHTIQRILTAPLLLHEPGRSARDADRLASEILHRVGLPLGTGLRYPHELSGGQRQRIGIARAVLLRPDFVLADEIVSGLDVSTQAQILRLIGDLSREIGLAMAFISHDLSVVRALCHRVLVLRQGEVVEQGACETVFAAPQSLYARRLIDAVPSLVPDPQWLARGVPL